MQIPPHVKNNPNFTLLSEYFTPEQVVKIVEAKIPVNRPGVVPSLQVPPGAKDCDGIPLLAMEGSNRAGVGVLEAWDPRNPYSHLSTDFVSVLSTPDYGYEQPTVQRAIASVPATEPDTALSWVNDNWLMIAAALGTVLVMSVATKRR